MRRLLVTIGLLLCASTAALAQVSVSIGMPGVSIGINLPVYPQLVPVPGYPVYYAPQANANYFFYDGLYWVYVDDNWYASSWYNGPWQLVYPDAVPLYVLRVPVRYYRHPPSYFRGWRADAPPRWDEHWGSDWGRRHSGWNEWNRRAVPAPAPLPSYQRQYSGNRYPHAEQQQALQNRNYRYQPRDEVVRQHYQPPRASAPGPSTQGAQGTRPDNRQMQQHPQNQQRSVPPRAPEQGARPPQAGGAPQRQGGEMPRQERSGAAPQHGGPKQERPQGAPQQVAPPPQSGQAKPRGEARPAEQTRTRESQGGESGSR